MPGCIGITNSHEHTAGEVHNVFLPELLEGHWCWLLYQPSIQNIKWMIGGSRVFEEVARHGPETSSFVSVVDSRVSMANTMRTCFCTEGERPRSSRVYRSIASSSPKSVHQFIDKLEWPGPRPPINIRWMTSGHRVLEEVASCRRETVTFV